MKKIFRILIITVLFLGLSVFDNDFSKIYAATGTVQKANIALSVSPLDVVNTPENYLKKDITFDAEFVAFTSLGLDYKPAYKDPAKFIGILIRRPDVIDHTIPLSEMKIFLNRETAEKYADIEAGDKIKITGTVFSSALGDPWVDITKFELLTQKDKKAE